MAISFPIWQAQLMRLQGAPQPQAPVWGPPDVTALLQRGAEGIGKALRQPDEDRREQEKIDLHRQQIEALQRYQQGQLGVEQGKLGILQQNQANWGKFATELGGLGGPYGPVAPGPPGAGGGGGAPGNASLGTPSLPRFAQGTLDPFKSAIQGIESGGNYGVVGPTHPKYGRALGAYQVMESNLPEWSREALGRKVSPEEFLASPAIQDRVFEHKFGNYLKIYGNPQDAASMWHSGRPLSVAAQARAKDSLGTSTTDYVSRFTQALGGTGMLAPAPGPMAGAPPPILPQQVASLDPTAGLVPPPMPGTPAPPPVDPQAKARDIGTQQQSVPGPALFPNPPTLPPGPGMQMPPPMPPGAPPAPSLPQPLSPPPPPVQTAQAAPVQPQRGLGPGEEYLRRQDPRLLRGLAAAVRTGDAAAIKAFETALGLVAPEPAYSVSDGMRVERGSGTIMPVPGMAQGDVNKGPPVQGGFQYNPQTNRYDIPIGGTTAREEIILQPNQTEERARLNIPADKQSWKVFTDASGILRKEPIKQDVREDPAFTQENTLRTQFETLTKPFRESIDAFDRFRAAVETEGKPTGPSDISLIFSFMKMQDPISAVREGEYATAQNSGGIEERVRNMYNKAIDGQLLQPEQRQDFLDQVWRTQKSTAHTYNAQVRRFGALARSYGLQPERVVPGEFQVPDKPPRIEELKPKEVTSEDEANKLPKGTRFRLNGRLGIVE